MFSSGQVTHLLAKVAQGDRVAEEELIPLIYGELRRCARAYLRRYPPGHTLQPTAVVHEAYIRLVGQRAPWRNRAHFLGVAADQMDRVLKDYARRRFAAKRGRGGEKVTLDSTGGEEKFGHRPEASATALSVHEALERLAQGHPRQARVARLRYLAGCTEREIAENLELSEEQIRRDWTFAKAWLKGVLG
jgi:RNA polymerase sigma-70 factor (ECF subfamily)